MASGRQWAQEEPAVRDLEWQFSQIAHHGDPLGFLRGVAADPDNCRHYQGVARLDSENGTPFLYVTRSDNNPGVPTCRFVPCDPIPCPGELLVVRMGSRGKHGERLRSNRLRRGDSFDDTPPEAADVTVRSLRFNGSNGWPAYMHPGGFQVIDEVLCVPVSDPIGNDSPSVLCLIDVRTREDPHVLHSIQFGRKLGVAAAIRDGSTQNILVAVSGEETDVVDFYEATEPVRSPSFRLTIIGTWTKQSDSWLEWQNINFLRQADGALYLAGSGTSDRFLGIPQTGDDWIRLFGVEIGGGSISLQLRGERHLYLDEPSLGDTSAGGGFHVTPSGQLLFYVTEHDNDGPGGSVKMGEFSRYDSLASCGGWVEFYEDTNGWHSDSPDRSVTLDIADYELEDWHNLDPLGFDDDIESIRWSLPPGTSVECYHDKNFTGDFITLTGAGVLSSLPDGLGDNISSVLLRKGPGPDQVLVCPLLTSGCDAHSVQEGLARLRTCETGGVLRLLAGDYREAFVIARPVTIIAQGGAATIGIGAR